MIGWIKIHRSIQDHWIFTDAEKYRAWMIILFEVNFDNKKEIIQGELVTCNRGQSIYSLDTWAKKFGKKWTIQKVRTFFNLLKKDKMITTEGLRKTTRLTVCNYDNYQNDQQTDNKLITDKQQTDNKLVTTTKERKERKEGKEGKEKDILVFDKFRILYLGKKRGLETEFENFTKKTKDWKEVLPVLKPAIENQISIRSQKIAATQFVPQWKNLQTWINQRCWEEIETSIQSNLLDNGLAD